MKSIRLLLLLTYMMSLGTLFSLPTAVAPADIVVSCNTKITIQQLLNYQSSPFGNMILNGGTRKRIITKDILCPYYCIKNGITNYPGSEPGKTTAANIACNYYNTNFDISNPLKIFDLDWGEDGHVNSPFNINISVSIVDKRNCGQGSILRKFKVSDISGLIEVTQTIWFVNCDPVKNDDNACNDSTQSHIIWPAGICNNTPVLINNCKDQMSPDNPELGKPRIIKAVDNECSLVVIEYSDEIFKIEQNACLKILRKWIVIDWCQHDPVLSPNVGRWEKTQTILVVDTKEAQILYPDSFNVHASGNDCKGIWEVPPPHILDNCSNDNRYTIESPIGILSGSEVKGYVLSSLPFGIHTVYLVVTDACNNISRKKLTINVTLKNPPRLDCVNSINVPVNGASIFTQSAVQIFANKLTVIPHDTCSKIYLKVIRQDQLMGTQDGSDLIQLNNCSSLELDDNATIAGTQTYFDDIATVCCSDLGTKIKLILRAFTVNPGSGPVSPSRMSSNSGDLYNTFKDCVVEVNVFNSIMANVVAPPNIVVSCGFNFDINKLKNLDDPTFGRIVTDLTSRKKVVTQDIVCHKYCEKNLKSGYPGFVVTNQVPKPAPNQACEYYNSYFDTAHKDRKYELVWGFDGYVLGNCNVQPTISVKDERVCGSGKITRTISVPGNNNTPVTATQTIWVIECEPFNISPNLLKGSQYTITGCGGNSGPYNRPQIKLDSNKLGCSLLSIEYRDDVKISIVSPPCFSIFRKWIILDWCQYDPFFSPTHGSWEIIDTIHVADTIFPEVEFKGGTCSPIDSVSIPGQKLQYLDILNSAKDDCSPADWLLLEYLIDLHSDGVNELRVGPLSKKQFAAGSIPIHNINPYALNKNNPFDASGKYPVGNHKITLKAEDGCGNTTTQTFEIKTDSDIKNPTPFCLGNQITVPMSNSECVTLWAVDFNVGSKDNCTPDSELKFYFDNSKNTTFIDVCCDDLYKLSVPPSLDTTYKIWVEDESGNKDFCNVKVRIVDHVNFCNFVNTFNTSDNHSILVYPNPTTGSLFIETLESNNLILNLRLQDLFGKDQTHLYNNISRESNKTELNIDHIRSGVYNLIIHTTSGIQIKKIIKN